ncbi:MAG TPA: TatD family hydrolase [Acidobacteriaceae bacterium]|nr:TatD family hydrolase [Acidobacteriaceae bacterium]
MLVDSHAHLDSPRYDPDRDALLERAWREGVGAILSIGIGDGPDTMHRALDLARSYAGRPERPRILASAGIHPHEARLADETAFSRLDALLCQPEVVAAGEIGLDYYYDHSPRERQTEVFHRQMEIAEARNRPIIIHCRPSEGSTDAWDDTMAVIESRWKRTGLGGILHCFTGEWDHARRAMDCGFLISFAGNVTFPKAEGIRTVAARVPLDRMLIETDAPFLAPVPYRGKRNEPAWVQAVATRLALVRGMEIGEIGVNTTNNFHCFLGTPANG